MLNSNTLLNIFNVLEVATLAAVTTAKTDADRSTAIVNGPSRFYNQSAAKTYEVETVPLTSDEAEWIDQLFTSYEVFCIEPDPTNEYDPLVLAAILITDSTCEIQDSDEKLNKVKFTWRFADNRRWCACLPRQAFSLRLTISSTHNGTVNSHLDSTADAQLR